MKIPTLTGISNCDLTNNGDNFDSLEDLNKELENLCPFNNASALLPHQLKIANSRFCDIFSRQSMESDENSSPDDEERIKFLATIPQTGCDVLQLVPKKPVVSSEHSINATMYQPCTNTIVQLKQSSFSAFRDMSEIKKQASYDEKEGAGGGDDDVASGGAAASQVSSSEDQQWTSGANALRFIISMAREDKRLTEMERLSHTNK